MEAEPPAAEQTEMGRRKTERSQILGQKRRPVESENPRERSQRERKERTIYFFRDAEPSSRFIVTAVSKSRGGEDRPLSGSGCELSEDSETFG